MKRLLTILLLLTPAACFGQNAASGNISASSTNCFSVASSCVWEQPLPPNAGTSTINISGTFSATLLVEESNNGGQTWSTAATLSAVGTTTYNTNGFTDIRVRCSAYTSGTAAITISTGLQQVQSVVSSAAPAGGAGLTQVVQSGLMAEYRMLPTEAPASLVDYSGTRQNATGTVGTAPTILANTGGVNCGGAGAIQLPSSLNPALTVMAYMSFQQSTGTAQQYNGPIVASGFANPGSVAFLLNQLNGTAGNYPIGGSSYFETFDGTGFQRTYAKMAWNGTGSWAVTMGASNNNIYVNGVAAPLFGSGTSAGIMSGQVYQICGNSFPSWFNGQIYYALFYNRVLTAAEVAQNASYLASVMAARGVPQSLTATDTNSQIVVDGDSISLGTGLPTNFPWPESLTVGGNSVQVQNVAAVGFGCNGNKSAFPLQVVPSYRSLAERNLYISWCGTNDVASLGSTAAQAWGFMRNLLHSARVQGYKVLVSTMVSRTGTGTGGATNDSLKNQLNALIRQNWSGEADGLVDVAANPQLGADGDFSNATYFQADGVHPTQHSSYNIETAAYNRAIARLYGAQDFSAANVYASAAPAATATTAGSESGSTVTLTFASNPFSVGQYITCSGITPAGYNSASGLGWLVLTANATQVTAWNPSTGLGAITVQGTCQTPQQQDGDKYVVLNFGAGNFTLNTCQGYTGQNLYIRNINAVASTLVPFGSETITGPGTTTVSASTTAILQAQLVSASAAGCNWVRLQ